MALVELILTSGFLHLPSTSVVKNKPAQVIDVIESPRAFQGNTAIEIICIMTTYL